MCWKLSWREFSKGNANEVNTLGSCKAKNQGAKSMFVMTAMEVFFFFFTNNCVSSWWNKGGISKTIRTSCCTLSSTKRKRRRKKRSNYSEMKAWQNERCFQLEPWLSHYFNIYKDPPPTAVRGYSMCAWESVSVMQTECEREEDRRRVRQTVWERGSGPGSDKLSLMNEPRSKKWLIHGYVPCISVHPPALERGKPGVGEASRLAEFR